MSTDFSIEVIDRAGDVSQSLRDWMRERVQQQLSRFSHEASKVTIRLSDESGPKGSVCKQVSVVLVNRRAPEIVVEEQADTYKRAFGLLLQRMKRLVLDCQRIGSRKTGRKARQESNRWKAVPMPVGEDRNAA